MNRPIPFLRLFRVLPLCPALLLKASGISIIQGVIDLKISRVSLRMKSKAPLTENDIRVLRESICHSYGFAEAELQIEYDENKEEIVMPMRLNITSGVVHRAQKVVIYGPEGIGKSTLASKFPGSLFTDTEAGTQHMDVRRTDTPTSWTMLLEIVKAVRDTPGVCQTYILDTADWAQQLCIRHVCVKHQVDNLEDIPYGRGYAYIWEEFGNFLNLLSEIVDRGVHVVVVAHATTKPANQPEEFGNYDRYQLKLVDSKQCSSSDKLKEWCDLLLFCNYKTYAVATNKQKTKFKGQGSQRTMYATRHACWDAKNRMGLPDELPLDYAPLAPYFDNAIPTSAPESNPAAPAKNIADHDMYFYHPESRSYWMIHAGEAIENIDVSDEITKEQYEVGTATGTEPYQNPIPETFPPEPPKREDASGPSNAKVHADSRAAPVMTSDPPIAGTCAADETVTVTPDGRFIGLDGNPLKDALQEFYPLMEMDGITADEVRDAVAQRGYFPADTPLANLPDDFIRGVLIGAWEQVKAMIEETRANGDLPF